MNLTYQLTPKIGLTAGGSIELFYLIIYIGDGGNGHFPFFV